MLTAATTVICDTLTKLAHMKQLSLVTCQAESTLSVVCDTFTERSLVKLDLKSGTYEIFLLCGL